MPRPSPVAAAPPPAAPPSPYPTTPPPPSYPPAPGYAGPPAQTGYPGYPPPSAPPPIFAPPPSPYVTADPSRAAARRPPGYRHRRRTTGAIVLSIGFIFTALGLGLGWWSESGSGLSIFFVPGSTATCTASTGSTCPTPLTYSSISSQMSTLYGSIEYMILAALILSVIAAAFAFLGAYGITFGRGQLNLVVMLGALAAVLCVAPVIYAAIGQPAAFQAANGGCSGASYCTSFFYGSMTSGGTTTNWGPYVGWYAALIGFIVLIVGAVVYSRTRTEPFTMDELASSFQAPAAGGTPAGAPQWGAAPPQQPSYPPYSGAQQPTWGAPPPSQPSWSTPPAAPSSPPPASWPATGAVAPTATTCARCGASNATTAATCWRCQAPLR